MMAARERLIFALDVPDRDAALRLVALLKEEVGLFKVGLELFTAMGPAFLEELGGELPGRIFLDLKFHDIPATVLGAGRALGPGVALTTIHSDLGPRGIKQVVAGLSHRVKILAVTVLTSLSAADLLALGYDPEYARDPLQLVLRKARLAQEAGCHGVVCSGREVKAVKEACGQDFLVVCPGIRPEWAAVPEDDQERSVSPYAAIHDGADYIVVGRPIRVAADPVAAAKKVVAEIARGMNEAR
jgi:orotidine-5'-phosphate decarboxylase